MYHKLCFECALRPCGAQAVESKGRLRTYGIHVWFHVIEIFSISLCEGLCTFICTCSKGMGCISWICLEFYVHVREGDEKG